MRRALPAIMAAVEAYQPVNCRSPQECLAATRDTGEIMQIMIGMFRDAPGTRGSAVRPRS